ncbi:MAG TPA: SNF2-related protein [Virgibacillus sp.]|nr:SNF2-related protein [Virgibacillus sp.]
MEFKYDENYQKDMEKAFEQKEHFSSWTMFKMAYQAACTTRVTSFDELQAIKFLPNVKFMSHQINAAKMVLEKMNGRAILADEVGLGKTIEAGLILKEYMLRGLVKNALILVPASLVNQWVQELNEKFRIPAIAYRKQYRWDSANIIVSSLDTAKQMKHQDDILNIDYDFLLIDEAHKLKNHKTKNYKFARAIKKTYCLLLTATPIQNTLTEIFNLVSILKPGFLGNYQSFKNQFAAQSNEFTAGSDFKMLIENIMIRHTRKETNLTTTKRQIKTMWVDFTSEESKTYEYLEKTLKEINLPTFTRLIYLRELCSSREALFLTLQKYLQSKDKSNHLYSIIQQVEQLPQHSKALKLVELLKQIGKEKVIIFTEFRATQIYLQWMLQQHNITSVPFTGGFKAGKKDWMRSLFKEKAQVLIATEAAGEGINLQFCNHLINYDLPWNPMRVEQRIGRIHRYGQEKDVYIYNFAIKNTIEEHIMKLLYEKIGLFEKNIGELDDILASLEINNLENELQKMYQESKTEEEANIKIENLATIIANSNT